MKVTSTTKIRFEGKFRERRANPRRVLGFIAGVVGIGALGYLFFFSPVFEIQSIEVQGFEQTNTDDVRAAVWRLVNLEQWSMHPYRSIILFDDDNAERGLAKQYPALKEIVVTKKYRHTLVVSGIERMPIGIWCLHDQCQYFDADRTTWGHAFSSSGSLLTVIENQQTDVELTKELVESAREVAETLPELGIAMKKIIIPADVPGEFHVHTAKPYILKLSLDADAEHQLETLRIFLSEKKKDPDFAPQEYIDLRIPERVYFK
jgi:cell division septal protein FtsQ